MLTSSSAAVRDGAAWPLILAATALLGTLASACMMPFVALAVATAATMSRTRAAATIGGIWTVNQIVGFGYLGYPWTGYAMMWGAALGCASIGAMLVAARCLSRNPRSITTLAATFLIAFIAYEASLFAFALVAGGLQTFTAPIIGSILRNDALWFVGLCGLHQALVHLAPRTFGPAPSLGKA